MKVDVYRRGDRVVLLPHGTDPATMTMLAQYSPLTRGPVGEDLKPTDKRVGVDATQALQDLASQGYYVSDSSISHKP